MIIKSVAYSNVFQEGIEIDSPEEIRVVSEITQMTLLSDDIEYELLTNPDPDPTLKPNSKITTTIEIHYSFLTPTFLLPEHPIMPKKTLETGDNDLSIPHPRKDTHPPPPPQQSQEGIHNKTRQ